MIPTIVAEIGAAHGGDLYRCKRLIQAAKDSGADYVKFQTYHPDLMVARKDYVIQSGPWSGKNLHQLYTEAMTPWEWFPELKIYCETIGMPWFSSPFSPEDVALLETLDCPMYKIASPEILDLELISAAGRTGKPVILSTGMASNIEIDHAAGEAYALGNSERIILACVSEYPALPSEYDLPRIQRLADLLGCNWGVSDHTKTSTLAVTATVMGATMIERHITLGDGSHDDNFASSPKEFKAMSDAVWAVELMRHDKKSPSTHHFLRRSLYYELNMKAGQILAPHDIRAYRPDGGIRADRKEFVVGHTLKRDVTAGEPVQWEHLE
jgi:N-acetylneuraminate synthase